MHGGRCDLQMTIFNSTFKARYSIPPSLSLSDEVKFRNCELRPIVTCFDSIGSPVVGRGGALGWRATPVRVLPSTKTVPTVVATLSIEIALDRAGPSAPQVRRLTIPVLGSLGFGATTTASSTSRESPMSVNRAQVGEMQSSFTGCGSHLPSASSPTSRSTIG